MVNRYFQLADFVNRNDEDLCELPPSARDLKKLRALVQQLKRVESVGKALQGACVTTEGARVWFNGLVGVGPTFEL